MSRLEFVSGEITNNTSEVKVQSKSEAEIELAENIPNSIIERSEMKYGNDYFGYWITEGPQFPDYLKIKTGYNGYIILPKSMFPGKEKDYIDLINHIDVCGGVTYLGTTKNWTILGFDTMHSYLEKLPITDKAWIRVEIKKMLLGALQVSQFNKAYLKAIKKKDSAVQKGIETSVSDTHNYEMVLVKNK